MSSNDAFSLVESLTEREEVVLAHLAQGKSNREIANALFLSINTIKWYNRQIFGKLGVANREEAVARARALGLLAQKMDRARRARALPSPATQLFGRQTELREIQAILEGGEARLLSIVGPGGIGKTRLALEVAHNLTANFQDGVAFASLAPLRSPEGIVTTLADALRFKFAAGADETRDERQQLLDYLREKSLLLVLDNFEHLLEGVTLLNEILESAPAVKLLVTSRERLRLQVEQVYSLQGLASSHWETVEQARRDPAVELFLQYGERVRRDYDLQAKDLDPLRHIMETVQGMPLAIILAAPWLELMEPAEIADEIERSLDFLEADYRDLPPRQRSVRAVFETTWARLSEREKTVFAALSVFRGGFSLEAAREVAGASPRVLLELGGQSLFTRGDSGRYSIHELLRRFGYDKLEAMNIGKVLDAQLSYYVSWAGALTAKLWGEHEEYLVQEIESELANVWAALEWAVGDARRAVSGLRLLSALVQCRPLRGVEREMSSWLSRLRIVAGDHLSLPVRASAALAGAILERDLRGSDLRELSEEALSLFQQTGNEEGLADALRIMGCVERSAQRWVLAQDYFEESLALFEALGSRAGIAKVHEELGLLSRAEQDWPAMRTHFETALLQWREVGTVSGIGWALSGAAEGALREGNRHHARAYLEESLELASRTHDSRLTGGVAYILGDIVRGDEDYQQAARLFQTSELCAKELGLKELVPLPMFKLGMVNLAEGETLEAELRFTEAMAKGLQFGNDALVMRCVAGVACTALLKGNPSRCVQLLAAGLTFFQGKAHVLDEIDRNEFDRFLDEAAQEMPEDAFKDAWNSGATLSINDIQGVVLER